MTDILSLIVATGSCVVSMVALAVSLIALRRSDRNTSLATLVSINQGLSDAWRHYLYDPSPEMRDLAFGDLTNLLEIGCAAYLSGSIHHESKKLLGQHLCGTLNIIEGHAPAHHALRELREAPATFANLRSFQKIMKKSGLASFPA